ncbi:hypothetical protein HD553DRAFT_327303 [Filobasidium floriforme]|uniref:uncharacterized protein n=1 Tax=Filobasidium floriforme TaxID=5210 RepID=UPI001E8D068F|nr:uncharacterized protein HD553DRAFT_327303 [Filobasidium floriforme]KAH8077420.1 hypothetical protein HD553DRAFT_327303 [Filobasidium floriforme]
MLLLSHFATLFAMVALARAHYMSQVHWTGTPYDVQVLNVTRPNITSPKDAIVRNTRAAICGSDLHAQLSRFPSQRKAPWGTKRSGWSARSGLPLSVTNVRVGGSCESSRPRLSNGYFAACPGAEDFLFGLQIQGEYARRQVADTNLIRISLTNETLTPELERDYLLASDVWPTAWQSIDRSGFQPGDNIAIWGAGPVGLLVIPPGCEVPVGSTSSITFRSDPTERPLSARSPVNFVTPRRRRDAPRRRTPEGSHALKLEALTANLTVDSNIVMRQMIAVSQLDGGIGIGGVYIMPPQGLSNPRIAEVSRDFEFDAQTYFTNRLVMPGGLLDARAAGPSLVNLIAPAGERDLDRPGPRVLRPVGGDQGLYQLLMVIKLEEIARRTEQIVGKVSWQADRGHVVSFAFQCDVGPESSNL